MVRLGTEGRQLRCLCIFRFGPNDSTSPTVPSTAFVFGMYCAVSVRAGDWLRSERRVRRRLQFLLWKRREAEAACAV